MIVYDHLMNTHQKQDRQTDAYMRKKKTADKRIFTVLAALFAVLMLCGCGPAEAAAAETEEPAPAVSEETEQITDDGSDAVEVTADEPEEDESVQEVAEAEESAEAPAAVRPSTPSASINTPAPQNEFKDSVFSSESAEGEGGVMVDTSHAAEGYFGVHSDSDTRIKIMVEKGDDTYIYDPVTGEDSIYPFQCGDGKYNIRVMKNAEGSKYFELFSTTADVTLESEFEPFLRPSDYSNYTQESACVAKAAEFASASQGEMDFISKVYEFVCDTVTYDDYKAETVQSGYLPDPDETMSTGKGICFDYAALTAAMLRSQGVPTKLIFGYVGKDELYHAWNMFYTEESGWITVEFQTVPGEWNRVDLTFYANGANSEFIGDGSNYVDIYQY